MLNIECRNIQAFDILILALTSTFSIHHLIFDIMALDRIHGRPRDGSGLYA